MDKRKESLSKDFVKIVNMEEEVIMNDYKRYTWIACRGIPVKAWSRATIESIACVWSNLLALKEDRSAERNGDSLFVYSNRKCKGD